MSKGGSFESTSSPAPLIISLLRAKARSSSSIKAPRLTLIRSDVGFIVFNNFSFTKPLLLSVCGQCNETTSASLKQVSKSTNVTPSILSRSGCVWYEITFIPNANAMRATACPIFPRPTIPNVFPFNSTIGLSQ